MRKLVFDLLAVGSNPYMGYNTSLHALSPNPKPYRVKQTVQNVPCPVLCPSVECDNTDIPQLLNVSVASILTTNSRDATLIGDLQILPEIVPGSQVARKRSVATATR